MAIIPTFQRQAQFTPQPVTSSADVFTALSTSVGAVQKAAETDITKEKKSALEANKFMTATDVIKQSSKIFDDAQQQTDKQLALEQYKKSYQSYATSLLAKVPKDNQLYTQRLLFSLGNQGAKKFQQQITEQGQIVAQEQFKSSFQALKAWATNNFINGNFNAQKNGVSAGGQLVDLVNKSVASGGLKAKAVPGLLQDTQKEFEIARIQGHGRLALQEGEQPFNNFVANIPKKYKNVFTSDEIKSIQSKVEADAAQTARRQGIDQQQLADMRANALVQMSENGKVDPLLKMQINNADPRHADEFNLEMQQAQLSGNAVNDVKYAPLSVSLKALEEAQRPLSATELAEPDIARTLKYRAKTADAIAKNIAAFKTNPTTWLKSDPEYQARVKKIINNTVTTSDTDPKHAEQVQRANQAILDYGLTRQNQMGLRRDQLTVIDGEPAATEVTKFNGLQASQIFPEIRRLEAQFGDKTNIAFKNLRDRGAKSAVNWLRGMADNKISRAHSTGIIEGFQLGRKKGLEALRGMKEGIFGRQVTETDLEQGAATALAPYFETIHATSGDALAYELDTREQVVTAAIGIMITEGKTAKEATQIAADSLVNNNYKYVHFTPGLLGAASKLLSPSLTRRIGAGDTFRIQADQDPVTVMRAADAMYRFNSTINRKNLVVPNYVKQQNPFASDAELEEIYFNGNFKNGHIINNNNDDGLIYTDSNKVPAMTKDNQPIGILFDNLNNPNSNEYKQMAMMEQAATEKVKQQFRKQFKEAITTPTQLITEPSKTLATTSENSIRELNRASFGDVREKLSETDVLSDVARRLIKPRKKK